VWDEGGRAAVGEASRQGRVFKIGKVGEGMEGWRRSELAHGRGRKTELEFWREVGDGGGGCCRVFYACALLVVSDLGIGELDGLFLVTFGRV
jgi:hypothetical protein